jgi:hypothetical protein
MAIGDYFINAFWWLFYKCFLVAILLMAIDDYFINVF